MRENSRRMAVGSDGHAATRRDSSGSSALFFALPSREIAEFALLGARCSTPASANNVGESLRDSQFGEAEQIREFRRNSPT
jgi:hypothetical protein